MSHHTAETATITSPDTFLPGTVLQGVVTRRSLYALAELCVEPQIIEWYKQFAQKSPEGDFGLPFGELYAHSAESLLYLCHVIPPDKTSGGREVGALTEDEKIVLISQMALERPGWAFADGPARVWRNRSGQLHVERPWREPKNEPNAEMTRAEFARGPL